MEEYRSPLLALTPEHAAKILRFCVEQMDAHGTWPGKQADLPAFDPARFEQTIREAADEGVISEEQRTWILSIAVTGRSPGPRVASTAARATMAPVDCVAVFHAAADLLVAIDQKRSLEEVQETLFALVGIP